MSPATRISLCTVISGLLIGCAPNPPTIVNHDTGPGIGPFDSRGNYREDWADDPSKWRRPTTAQPPVIASNNTSSSGSNIRSTSSGSGNVSSTPPPPKPKPKPQVTRHTVQRGDTLSAIAKRYGSNVAAIRRANGISGSLIHPGQKLVVPR